MKTINRRIEQLEQAATPTKEKLYPVTYSDREGYYVGSEFYPDLQAVEAAYPDRELIILRVVYTSGQINKL